MNGSKAKGNNLSFINKVVIRLLFFLNSPFSYFCNPQLEPALNG